MLQNVPWVFSIPYVMKISEPRFLVVKGTRDSSRIGGMGIKFLTQGKVKKKFLPKAEGRGEEFF